MKIEAPATRFEVRVQNQNREEVREYGTLSEAVAFLLDDQTAREFPSGGTIARISEVRWTLEPQDLANLKSG